MLFWLLNLLLFWRSRCRCRRRRRILKTLIKPPVGKCWNSYFKTYNKTALSELVILLKLGSLSWKLKIIKANFFCHLPPKGFWLIFSMLFNSYPTIKWRGKNFCWFDAATTALHRGTWGHGYCCPRQTKHYLSHFVQIRKRLLDCLAWDCKILLATRGK